MQNATNKYAKNMTRLRVLVWECASKVLEGLKNFSSEVAKLASLKEAIATCVKQL